MNRNERMLLIAMAQPELFVAQITYLDARGTVTDRVVSPVLYLTEDVLRAYCLGREAVRSFRSKRILRVRLKLSADCLCPEALATLVSHTNKLRPDKSTETIAER